MDTIKVKVEDVARGSMLPGWNGVVIADTLSADEKGPFWYDTSSGKHYADADGTLTVYVPIARTQANGKSAGKNGAVHALENVDKPICPQGRRSGTIQVWNSGTALAGVTCGACRSMLNLMPNAQRQSNGI